MGTKLDYFFFYRSQLTQASEKQLLKNQREQERTQLLSILMLSLENPCLAGFMLTRNRSMFLETDGSLAWLHHCSLVHSPFIQLTNFTTECRYSPKARFISMTQSHGKHSRRRTYEIVPTESKNSLKIDKDQEGSWYTLTSGTVHQKRPAVFGPKDVSEVTVFYFPGSQEAGIYTRSELNSF